MRQSLGGERGIRTPGPVTVNGFQDRRNRPLCHLSGGKSSKVMHIAKRQWQISVVDLCKIPGFCEKGADLHGFTFFIFFASRAK